MLVTSLTELFNRLVSACADSLLRNVPKMAAGVSGLSGDLPALEPEGLQHLKPAVFLLLVGRWRGNVLCHAELKLGGYLLAVLEQREEPHSHCESLGPTKASRE